MVAVVVVPEPLQRCAEHGAAVGGAGALVVDRGAFPGQHLGRGEDRRRRVREIGVVTRDDRGLVEVVAGVVVGDDGRLRGGPGLDALTALVEP